MSITVTIHGIDFSKMRTRSSQSSDGVFVIEVLRHQLAYNSY